MGKIKLLLLSLSLILVASNTFAIKKTAEKSSQDKVYIFGVGSAFGDTIVHFTSIIEMDGIELEKKTNFLPFRSVYSLQLKAYLEGTLGYSKQTCSVIFSKSKKSISKKYYKLKKEYLEESGSEIRVIGENEFKFSKPQ